MPLAAAPRQRSLRNQVPHVSRARNSHRQSVTEGVGGKGRGRGWCVSTQNAIRMALSSGHCLGLFTFFFAVKPRRFSPVRTVVHPEGPSFIRFILAEMILMEGNMGWPWVFFFVTTFLSAASQRLFSSFFAVGCGRSPPLFLASRPANTRLTLERDMCSFFAITDREWPSAVKLRTSC